MDYRLRSCQWLNFRRDCVLAAEAPVLQQFLSKHHRPFADQIQSPAWQLALEDLKGGDFNRGFEFAISGVENGVAGDH
jgi:hypothetical protein